MVFQLSYQLVESAIVEQAGSVILNKVNEVNLAVASTVSDRVIDEVVESLSKTCKNLVSVFEASVLSRFIMKKCICVS